MKKLVSVLLVFIVLVCLAACGAGGNYDDKISELTDKLNTLQNEVNTLKAKDYDSQIGTLNSALLSMKAQVETLEGVVDSINEQIETIESNIINLQSQAQSVSGTITALQSEVEALKTGGGNSGQIQAIEETISTLQGQYSSISGTISSLQSDVATLKNNTYASQITSLSERISTLESKVEILESFVAAHEDYDDTDLKAEFTRLSASLEAVSFIKRIDDIDVVTFNNLEMSLNTNFAGQKTARINIDGLESQISFNYLYIEFTLFDVNKNALGTIRTAYFDEYSRTKLARTDFSFLGSVTYTDGLLPLSYEITDFRMCQF